MFLADGESAYVSMVVRGCVPVEDYNPYSNTGCVDVSSTSTNPYVMAIIHDLNALDYSVAPMQNSVLGKFCKCNSGLCNSSTRELVSATLFAIVLVLISC